MTMEGPGFDPASFKPVDGFDPDAYLQELQQEKRAAEYDRPIAAALAGALRGPTLGASDLFLTGTGLVKKETLAGLKEYNPGISMGAEVLSSLATLPLSGGAGAVGTAARAIATPMRAADMAGKLVQASALKALGGEVAKSSTRKILDGAAAKALGLGIEGSFYGAGQIVSEAALGDPKQAAEKALSTIGLSAILSGGLGGSLALAAPAIKGIAGAMKPAADSILQGLTGVDGKKLALINSNSDEVARIAGLADDIDESILINGREKATELFARKNQVLDDISTKLRDQSSTIMQAQQYDDILKELGRIKSRISPDDIRVNADVKSAFNKIENIETTLKDLGYKNLDLPIAEDAQAIANQVTRNSIDDFVQKRQTWLDDKWARLDDEVRKITRDEPAISAKQFLTKIDEEIRSIKPVGDGPKADIARLQSLRQDVEVLAKKNLGYADDAKVALKDLYLKGSDIVALKKTFQDYAEYGVQVGQATKMGTVYRDLARIAKQELDAFSPEIKAINKDLQKAIVTSKGLSGYGFTRSGAIDEPTIDRMVSLIQSREKGFQKYQKYLVELDNLYGTNLMGVRNQIRPILYRETIPENVLQINAGQLNEIREQIAGELASISKSTSSKLYESLEGLHDTISGRLEKMGVTGAKELSSRQTKLLNALQDLRRYGLLDVEPDAAKFKDFLLTSTRQDERLRAAVDVVEAETGMPLKNMRDLNQAVHEIYKSGPVQRLKTGASWLAPGAGLVLGSLASPLAGAAAFVGGAMLQSPKNYPKALLAMTRAQESAQKAIAGAGKFLQKTSPFIPPNIAPVVAGQVSALATLERQQKYVDNKIDRAASAFTNRFAEPDEDIPSLDATRSTNFGKVGNRYEPNRIKAFHDRTRELSDIVNNPDRLTDMITNNLKQLSLVAPEIASNLAMHSVMAAQFLYSKAPKSPISDPYKPLSEAAWRPSDTELSKFERYMQAVDSPMASFKDFVAGRMTREQAETLQVLYPTIYNQFSQKVLERVQKQKKPLTQKQRHQLDVLFGKQVANLSRLQQNYGQAEPPSMGTKPIQVSGSRLTETQRIQGRNA